MPPRNRWGDPLGRLEKNKDLAHLKGRVGTARRAPGLRDDCRNATVLTCTSRPVPSDELPALRLPRLLLGTCHWRDQSTAAEHRRALRGQRRRPFLLPLLPQ